MKKTTAMWIWMTSDKKHDQRMISKKSVLCVTIVVLILITVLCGCENREESMKDGFYTAEAAFFDNYGWKEYVAINVSNNQILTVDYNAKNASGFIKSWDMEYMRTMNAVDKTYPNEYTRTYADELLNRQDPEKVDVVTGATHSHTSFQKLAEAAMQQARTGDETIVYIDLAGASH